VKGFYGFQPRARNGIPKRRVPASNPYEATGAGYAERNRETRTTLPTGIVRVDKGEPLVPPHGGVVTSTPTPKTPAPAPAAPPAPPAAPHVPRKSYRPLGEFKPGIGRG